MILDFNNVSFRYPNSGLIVEKASFSLARGGERLFLVGPSGSGKSTLMKLALGLLQPTSGIITARATKTIPIMQSFASSLLPWFSTRRNLLFALRHCDMAFVEELIDVFEIHNCVDVRPTMLSGGQIQRALFVRALCHRPDMLLVDEPLSNLDVAMSERILGKLAPVLSQLKLSVFWITHRHFEARILASRVMHMDNHSLRELRVADLVTDQRLAT